jgi:hypothetical protein
MLDLCFLERLVQSGHQRAIEFTNFLFEEYSKRGLRKKTDRCITISGFEARIPRAKECKDTASFSSTYIGISCGRHPIRSWSKLKGNVRYYDC